MRAGANDVPAAVIFDCDGTLVDSERLAQRSWIRLLSGYGYELTSADVDALFGRPYPAIYDYLAARAGVPSRVALWDDFLAIMSDLMSRELVVFDDAVRTVRELADAGIPLAVASSSPRDHLARTLSLSQFTDLFAVIVAGDEIERGKPAPDIFLAAAEALAVPIDRCVVVEDSPAGVGAGIAAGAGVVAVARQPEHRAVLADAHVLVDVLDVGAIRQAASGPLQGAIR